MASRDALASTLTDAVVNTVNDNECGSLKCVRFVDYLAEESSALDNAIKRSISALSGSIYCGNLRTSSGLAISTPNINLEHTDMSICNMDSNRTGLLSDLTGSKRNGQYVQTPFLEEAPKVGLATDSSKAGIELEVPEPDTDVSAPQECDSMILQENTTSNYSITPNSGAEGNY